MMNKEDISKIALLIEEAVKQVAIERIDREIEQIPQMIRIESRNIVETLVGQELRRIVRDELKKYYFEVSVKAADANHTD